MNKVVVGVSPSPNLRKTSKIGSLANSAHKPGGGQVKIENRKLDWNVAARTVNVNSGYAPSGGDKKVIKSVFIFLILTHKQSSADRAEEAELECWLPDWFPGEGGPQTWGWPGQDRKQKAGLELSQLQGGQQEKHQPSARRGKCRNSQREVGFPGGLQDWISGQREASTRWRRQEDIRRQGVRQADERGGGPGQVRVQQPHQLHLGQLREAADLHHAEVEEVRHQLRLLVPVPDHQEAGECHSYLSQVVSLSSFLYFSLPWAPGSEGRR